MSEAETPENTAADTPQGQQFGIQRVYVKDVSFETPNSPGLFATSWEPQVGIELHSTAAPLNEHTYEVVLTLTVTCKADDKTAYLVEVKQAGIFTLAGFDQGQLGHMIGSYCPNILYPYAREVVTNLVAKGTFPQLVLAPINFDALYAQHLAQQQQQAQPQPADIAH